LVIADVLHVPQEYLTIQTALDSLSDGDTVVVEPGTYMESLQCPELTFSLFGAVDSAGNRPVVDPSLLPQSTSLMCVHLPPCHATIRDFDFRNGPEMYPREHLGDIGGIRNTALELTLSDCLFDSTYYGVYRPMDIAVPADLLVRNCQFLNVVREAVFDQDTQATKQIHNCNISGSGPFFIRVAKHAGIENCIFDGSGLQYPTDFIWLTDEDTGIRGCTFSGPPLPVTPVGSLLYTDADTCANNVFDGFTLRTAAIDGSVGRDGATAYYHHNQFVHCRGQVISSAGGGIRLNGYVGRLANVVIDSCTFDSCTTFSVDGFGALKVGDLDVSLTHTSFRWHDAPAPTIWTYLNLRVELHDCSFEHTGFALRADDQVNAELNWWGDSTGPYHAQLNPGGLGDTIQGNVDFIPWIGDTAETATSPKVAVPKEFQLQIYPNPFNPATSLSFSLPERAWVKLQMYDLTGRTVMTLAQGWYETGEHHVCVDGSGLATAIYFARMTAGNHVATRKLVMLK
jgi:hypothetical protein